MKRWLAVLPAVFASPAFAQDSLSGLWRTVDDTTGRVRIVDHSGVLLGRIEGSQDPSDPPHRICDLYTDERKGKPLPGLTILRGARRLDGVRDGGDILGPGDGKVYRVRLRLLKDGKELEVRGRRGIPLLGRTQIWTRAE